MPGAPPPSEPRASPEAWDCLIQSIQSFINRTRASLRLARARQEKPLACFALQSAAFGVLPRAVWALSLRARACAGPRRHALAVHRGRAGVQWRVAACKCVVRSWCNVVQCCANVACVVPSVRVRWPKRDHTLRSSCVHAGAGRKSAARGWCAFVLWLVLCANVRGRTALQPAQMRAHGGQGAASAYCRGRGCAREPPSRRVAAWPVSVRWASGVVRHTIVFLNSRQMNPRGPNCSKYGRRNCRSHQLHHTSSV